MMRSLWTAATGMQAQTSNIDVISNNLANVNTAGFKRSRADFQDLLYETIRAPGTSTAGGSEVPTGVQVGHGTRTVATQKIFMQGDFQHTQNELDLAIEGGGFFQIQQANGDIGYSRAGNFKIDSEGRIVSPDGFLMEPEITIPTDAIAVSIGMDGAVSVLQPGATAPAVVGNIELARFVNPAGLRTLGSNLAAPTEASGNPEVGNPDEDGFGSISQGFLETSNVNVAEELVNMILAQRAFEMNSRVIQAGDQMLQTASALSR